MNADAVIVGLGNPGPRYSFTRHNVGFIALDVLTGSFGTRFTPSKKLNAETAEISDWKGKRVLLVKPQTYMNLSGESVRALYAGASHLREKPLVVLHDEVDLPFGRIRIKIGGGDAGHNGLKSIRGVLGHGDFARVRMGVGRPPIGSPIDLADYVLASFKEDERVTLAKLVDDTLDVTASFLKDGLELAQRLASKA